MKKTKWWWVEEREVSIEGIRKRRSHISSFDIGNIDNYHEEMVKPPDDERSAQHRGSSQDIDRLGYLSIRRFLLNTTCEGNAESLIFLPHCSTTLVLIRGKCSDTRWNLHWEPYETSVRGLTVLRAFRIFSTEDIFVPRERENLTVSRKHAASFALEFEKVWLAKDKLERLASRVPWDRW